MEVGKANRYAALQEGEWGPKFCQKVRYLTVERSHRPACGHSSFGSQLLNVFYDLVNKYGVELA